MPPTLRRQPREQSPAELDPGGSVSLVIDEVIHLIGIPGQVVQLLQIPDPVVLDILQSAPLDGECGGRLREGPFPVVFIDKIVLDPVLDGDRSGRNGQDAVAFKLCRRLDARQIQEGRRQVQVAYPHRIGDPLGQQARRVGHHRHADGRLIGVALVDQPVLAHQEPVVAGEDDQGVVLQLVLSQVGQGSPEIVIHRAERGEVGPEIGRKVALGMVRKINAVPAVALVLHPNRLAAIVPGRIGHAVGHLDIEISVLAHVARGRLGVGVHRLVGQIEEEGL